MPQEKTLDVPGQPIFTLLDNSFFQILQDLISFLILTQKVTFTITYEMQFLTSIY